MRLFAVDGVPSGPNRNPHDKKRYIEMAKSRTTFNTPETLVEAHDVLARQRPKLEEKPLVWVAFHRLCAEVYAQVAKTDVAHKYEAQSWAGASMRQAREIEGDDNLPDADSQSKVVRVGGATNAG